MEVPCPFCRTHLHNVPRPLRPAVAPPPPAVTRAETALRALLRPISDSLHPVIGHSIVPDDVHMELSYITRNIIRDIPDDSRRQLVIRDVASMRDRVEVIRDMMERRSAPTAVAAPVRAPAILIPPRPPTSHQCIAITLKGHQCKHTISNTLFPNEILCGTHRKMTREDRYVSRVAIAQST